MFSTWINAHMDVSNHGMLHSFKYPRAVANGLTGIKTMVKCLFIFNWSCINEGCQVSTEIQIWRIEVRGSWELHLETSVFANIYWCESFSLLYFGKLSPDICPSVLDTHCVLLGTKLILPDFTWRVTECILVLFLKGVMQEWVSECNMNPQNYFVI
jgi:hypothetical protein